MRKLFVLVAAVALVGGACGNDKKSSSTSDTTAKSGGASSYTVQLDGKADAFNGAFTAFFPNDPSVHPGDTVTFKVPRVGEPHTVAMGTSVDAGVKKIESLGPTATIAGQENAPEVLDLPDVFPHAAGQGPPSPNQSAAQPCFLATGKPPLSLSGGAPACPKVPQPEFDGTQTFYNSGLLFNDGDTYTVKLSKDIKPGSYAMMCMIHRGAMTGHLTVAAAGTSIPSPSEVAARGQSQLNDLITKLTPAAQKAQQSPVTAAALGTGDPQVFNAVVAEFGPKNVSIPVGGTVTWNEFAFHSLSFNAADSDVGVFTKSPDGAIAFNLKALGPVGFNVPPAAFAFPPPDNGKPILIDGGKWDGTGFRSTGVIGSLPPVFISIKQTFTKAGTYQMRCLFHADMKGTVKVG